MRKLLASLPLHRAEFLKISLYALNMIQYKTAVSAKSVSHSNPPT